MVSTTIRVRVILFLNKTLIHSDLFGSYDDVFSRNEIDLAMMTPSLPLLRKAQLKAQGAYGKAVALNLELAIERLQNRPD